MTSMENQFRPTFGRTPPELLDRGTLSKSLNTACAAAPVFLGLLTIITGARGVGKTVMLNEAQDLARGQGWAVISETSTDGFLTRIADAAWILNEPHHRGPQAWPPALEFAGQLLLERDVDDRVIAVFSDGSLHDERESQAVSTQLRNAGSSHPHSWTWAGERTVTGVSINWDRERPPNNNLYDHE